MRRTLILTLLLAPLAGAQDDRPERRVDDLRLQHRINEAIDRGIAYLKSVQAPDGSWDYGEMGEDATGGLTALALYALAASGVEQRDTAIERGVRWTRKHTSPYGPGATFGTYSASLLILALTRIDAQKHQSTIHTLAERLVEAQLVSDLWTYRLKSSSTQGGGRGGGRRAVRPAGMQGGDNSNSQFAVLALWAAFALAEFEVPDLTWQRIQQLYEETQLEDGGWSYRPRDRRAGVRWGGPSMNAAGLVSYVYATAALLGGPEALQAARKSGVARRGVRLFEGSRRWNFDDYYFVYSLERVGTVLDLPEDDWYVDGARVLVGKQGEAGAWDAPGGHGDARQVYETSLALLFLSRATSYASTPGGRTDRPRPTARRNAVGMPDPGQRGNLERAFSYYLALDEKSRARSAADFGRAGPAAIELFVARLDDSRLAVREAAFELLDRLLERKFFFEPGWPASERKLMLEPIERYWTEHGESLAWDPDQRLFVER